MSGAAIAAAAAVTSPSKAADAGGSPSRGANGASREAQQALSAHLEASLAGCSSYVRHVTREARGGHAILNTAKAFSSADDTIDETLKLLRQSASQLRALDDHLDTMGKGALACKWRRGYVAQHSSSRRGGNARSLAATKIQAVFRGSRVRAVHRDDVEEFMWGAEAMMDPMFTPGRDGFSGNRTRRLESDDIRGLDFNLSESFAAIESPNKTGRAMGGL